MDNYRLERVARAYLMEVTEEPGLAVKAFVAEVGAVEAAARVHRGDVPEKVGVETSERRLDAEMLRDHAMEERLGARLVIPEDSEWPGKLLSGLGRSYLEDGRLGTPLGLWVRGTGRVADVLERAVAVVGTRTATSYGSTVAEVLGNDLARAGVAVVSGAAFGISESVHRGVVSAGGVAVTVLGCGLMEVGHSRIRGGLSSEIAESELVLSEYAPDRAPSHQRSLGRNRLVACLGAGTVVVEAGQRSGSRTTARAAAALGRVVMAVPGPVTSSASAGCHELLRGGEAVAVASAAEVLESCGLAARPEVADESQF